MSTIIFPSSPFNGQIYPEIPITGLPQYVFNAQSETWELLGGGEPCCGVTLVNTGTGLTGGPITGIGTVSLADTTVTPGSYTNANITVDAQGRITLASSGTSGGVEQIVAGTGISISPPSGTGIVTVSALSDGSNNATLLDDISSLFDGTTTTFNLTSGGSPYEPPNAVQMIVTVGNIMQEAYVEYDVSGSTITFTTAPQIGLDCILLVLGGGQATPARNLLLDDIQAGFDGIQTTFNLTYEGAAYTPINEVQLIVTLDDAQLKPEGEYTVLDDTITFATAPAAGQKNFIIALYGGGFGAGGPSVFSIDANNNIWSCNTPFSPSDSFNNFLVGQCAGANIAGCYQYNNTFIGNYAGFCAGTLPEEYVDDNIFIGECAGYAQTEGYYNIFLGRWAGRCSVAGTDNFFAGFSAGCYNSFGSNNTFIGEQAGKTNTTGSGNNFIGKSSGFYNTTGGVNNFIGSCAGYTNTSGFSNNFIGECAGYCNCDGYRNNFLGFKAGVGSIFGDNNNFIGSYAGCSNVSGNSNNFIGELAGTSNVTGFNNNFIGTCSGYSNTEGYGNDFMGFCSGYSTTTGFRNIFIGYMAGRQNLGGFENVFAGSYAGLYNTTGYANTFVGLNAGRKTTTGFQNTFIGNGTAYENTTGEENTFMGDGAGFSNTTGSRNVFVGKYAGIGASSGSANVLIGDRAGQNVKSGNCNIFIGHCSAPLLSGSTTANNIAIGRQAGGDAVLNLTTQSNVIVLGNNSHTNAYIKVNWTVTSDERDKTCITPLKHGAGFIQQLSPIQYNWKDRETGEVADETPRYGFLAQEILAAEGEPSVLVDNQDPENLKLRETMIIPVLVNAFKELSAKYDSLAEELAALKSQLN